ncbi:thioredoxin-like protein [Dacryopinax primogenitus]|uniref:Thioredoxin-like protein n=1 Tax=Dacryopinax primogenitus (strain DJM 731) TaxID=1858805 RepID=M5G500_DACPD|nr:thioredoxin-like protein [Dacryopinax primogenitus]EJU03729.1 thioredoxin-like protein [Dacryopinax primogenitus]
MLRSSDFHRVLSEEKTSIVAFVAPWCGHCQKMSPEYEGAARSLSPLIPFYAVDCDAEENKPLCGSQGIKGFPTLKSFPRGLKGVAHDYQQERTAGPIIDWAKSEVPNRVKVLRGMHAVNEWIDDEEVKQPKALLLTDKKQMPILWRVLGANFHKRINFAIAKDEDQSIGEALDLGTDKTKVVTWKDGERTVYDGTLNFDSLTPFFEILATPSQRPRDEL